MHTVISTAGMVPKVKSEQIFRPDTCLVVRGTTGVLLTALPASTGLSPLDFFGSDQHINLGNARCKKSTINNKKVPLFFFCVCVCMCGCVSASMCVCEK